jgi:hypothetical protein
MDMTRQTALCALLMLALAVPTQARAQHEGVPPSALGGGTNLEFRNCYEHVGGFRLPVAQVADLGGPLPPGFEYRVFDAAGNGQLVAVGLDCDFGGTRVTDVFINAVVIPPPGFTSTLLRVRSYTSRPDVAVRFAQWCFGDAVNAGEVTAEVTVSEMGRTGRVFGSDEVGSIELTTATGATQAPVPPATIQHVTVKDQQVHGLLEFTADGAVIVRGTGSASAQLRLDGGPPIPGFTGQHIFPAPRSPFTLVYRGLTACPPGQDWTD